MNAELLFPFHRKQEMIMQMRGPKDPTGAQKPNLTHAIRAVCKETHADATLDPSVELQQLHLLRALPPNGSKQAPLVGDLVFTINHIAKRSRPLDPVDHMMDPEDYRHSSIFRNVQMYRGTPERERQYATTLELDIYGTTEDDHSVCLTVQSRAVMVVGIPLALARSPGDVAQESINQLRRIMVMSATDLDTPRLGRKKALSRWEFIVGKINITARFDWKKRGFGFDPGDKVGEIRLHPYVHFCFEKWSDRNRAAEAIYRQHDAEAEGWVQAEVPANAVLQFLDEANLIASGTVRVSGARLRSRKRVAFHSDYEFHTTFDPLTHQEEHMKAMPDVQEIGKMMLCSFDIEAFSLLRMFPSALNKDDVIICIAARFYNTKTKTERLYVLALRHRKRKACPDQAEVEDMPMDEDGKIRMSVRLFDDELEMAEAFRDLVVSDTLTFHFSLSLSLSLSLFLSLSRVYVGVLGSNLHTRTHAHTHTRTHAHTRTHPIDCIRRGHVLDVEWEFRLEVHLRSCECSFPRSCPELSFFLLGQAHYSALHTR
jgi:hypothetical protein